MKVKLIEDLKGSVSSEDTSISEKIELFFNAHSGFFDNAEKKACFLVGILVAMHIVARQRLGMPQSSAEAFQLIHQAGYINKELLKDMIAMTGFRNIAIHEYQQMDMSILRHIAETRWQSLVAYCKALGVKIEP